jgi:hypothetical protein
MTIIAFKDGVMAADTMLSSYNSQSRAQKIIRLPDGGVAGGCGLWARAYSGLRYLAEGGDCDDRPAPDGMQGPPCIREASILIAKPDGSLWLLEDEFPAFPLRDKVAAVGCGSEAAMMAMGLGLSAIEAVAKVTKQDVLCGDPVQSMEVQQPHEYPEAVTHSRRSVEAQSAKAPRRKRR